MSFAKSFLAFYPLAVLFSSHLSTAVPVADQKRATAVPDYVTTFAPLIWLEPQDTHYPSDIGAQLVHTKPELNLTPITNAPSPLTLSNLGSLNALGGKDVYLTSVDDITTNPAWLSGVKPDGSGKTSGAVSSAVIVNDKGDGTVDAFYMFFYAFNAGPPVLGQPVNNHVGDWEHTMVRFKNGQPQAMWFSQHEYGEAFTYGAVEKQGQRPVGYSARGSHATYATTGSRDHTIPGLNLPKGLLIDNCGQGTLWDPIKSAYFYSYNANGNSFTAYDGTSPTDWLNYIGHWGDKQYPDSDKRQKKFIPGVDATAKFSSGPTGPVDKQLNRKDVCIEFNQFACFVSPVLRS